MVRIFLIGYMGSGKTTLGRAFSNASGLQFIDLDWYIEERMHKTVSEIFAAKGEDGFRIVEKNMLHEVAQFENVVIACGGGTPCFFDNMDFMKSQGRTVFLDVDKNCLLRRLKQAKSSRPLLADKSDEDLMKIIEDGMHKRLPFYSQADIIIDGSMLESKTQIEVTIEKLNKELISKNYI